MALSETCIHERLGSLQQDVASLVSRPEVEFSEACFAESKSNCKRRACAQGLTLAYHPHPQMQSYAQGLLSPSVLQARVRGLHSRLQALADETNLLGHINLPQRPILEGMYSAHVHLAERNESFNTPFTLQALKFT